MAFSSMLKQLREEKHLSQKDIAVYLGITRQAVASYELAKREPDYETLRKLADYFGVSIDYLLGRANCRDENAFTVGKNIELIRGSLTYKELSEDISRKTGALIFPEMLELYARGERMPFIGTIKILAKYASVRDSFFFTYNTAETYQLEKNLFSIEAAQANSSEESNKHSSASIDYFENDIKQWVVKEDHLPYIKLAKEIQEVGLSVEVLRPLIDSFKISKK